MSLEPTPPKPAPPPPPSSIREHRSGFDPATDVGPLISPKAKDRCEALVTSGIRDGAACPLDGRGVTVPGFEKGNFVGPTLLTVRSRNKGPGRERPGLPSLPPMMLFW